jgi:hypothetical protein
MKRILIALTSCLLALGCGSDDCDDALDKLSECGLGAEFAGVDFDDDECDGRIQCVAECINGLSCAEINAAGPETTYQSCVRACG